MPTGRSRSSHSPVRCTHCAQIIGVYEPVIVLDPSGPYEASLVSRPDLRCAKLPRLHRGCAEAIGVIG